MINYMGLFVEEETKLIKHCTNCKFEKEVDRTECNQCSREWGNSGYLKFIGWKPKNNGV
jgi:hypothetical protein